MIANKYQLGTKLTNGSFGVVYKGENIRTKETVAIKFEAINSIKKTIKNEAKIYQYLGKLNGFPKLKWFGTIGDDQYLVIDYLGQSLETRINQYKSFSLKTSLLIGVKMIERIQTLHEKYLLHRDVKPDNFLFGLQKETNKIFLIDFGISKRYDHNGIHINENSIKNIIGTPNFVSLNVHLGIEPSRRDDLESVVYIIMYMLFGNLKWFNRRNCDDIAEIKSNIHTITVLPVFIKNMLGYVRRLSFNETPDYNYLVSLMVNTFEENGYVNDGRFEWTN